VVTSSAVHIVQNINFDRCQNRASKADFQWLAQQSGGAKRLDELSLTTIEWAEAAVYQH
jgi:hypothetical protein